MAVCFKQKAATLKYDEVDKTSILIFYPRQPSVLKATKVNVGLFFWSSIIFKDFFSQQNLTSKKKTQRLKSDGAAKKISTLKSSDAMPSVFENVFPDIETMHIFDEEKRKMIILKILCGVQRTL